MDQTHWDSFSVLQRTWACSSNRDVRLYVARWEIPHHVLGACTDPINLWWASSVPSSFVPWLSLTQLKRYNFQSTVIFEGCFLKYWQRRGGMRGFSVSLPPICRSFSLSGNLYLFLLPWWFNEFDIILLNLPLPRDGSLILAILRQVKNCINLGQKCSHYKRWVSGS